MKLTEQKYSYLLILICLFFRANNSHAQWEDKDSVWLQDILSGKQQIQLNPETMKAIESGNFLNIDPETTPMLSAPSQLPILKDFSEYLGMDTAIHLKIALKDLPPSVFWHYGKDLKLPKGFLLVSDDLFKVPLEIRQIKTDGMATFSFAEVLAYTFSPVYRQKQRNKVTAVAWKEYTRPKSSKIPYKDLQFRTTHPELVLPDIPTLRKDTMFVVSPTTNQSFSVPDSISEEALEDSLLYKTLPN